MKIMEIPGMLMKRPKIVCENCEHYESGGSWGNYTTPICDIYGLLEDLDNPHHDLNGLKCEEFKMTQYQKYFYN